MGLDNVGLASLHPSGNLREKTCQTTAVTAVSLVNYESQLRNVLFGIASLLHKLVMSFTVWTRRLCFQRPRTEFFNCLILIYIVM